jgi:hypothetical protein
MAKPEIERKILMEVTMENLNERRAEFVYEGLVGSLQL